MHYCPKCGVSWAFMHVCEPASSAPLADEDLITQLRTRANARHSGEVSPTAKLCAEAASRIEELAQAWLNAEGKISDLEAERDAARAELKRLRKSADPFMRLYKIQWPIAGNWGDDKPLSEFIPGVWPTWGDLKGLFVAHTKINRKDQT